MRNSDLKRYITIVQKIKGHEGAIGELKEKKAQLENALMKNMIDGGIQRCSLDGHTVYIKRELWAGAGEAGMPALVAALKAAGLGDLVSESAGAQKLSAWVREHDPDKKDPPEVVISRLPEAIRPVVKVSEKYGLHVVKAA